MFIYCGEKYEVLYENEKNVSIKNSETRDVFKLPKKQFLKIKESQIEIPNDIKFISPFLGTIDYFELQYLPLQKLMKQTGDKRNLFIGDAVGVGKTIEGGIIITELMVNNIIKKTDRNLIICPNILKDKWITELRNKFNIVLTDITDIEKIKNFVDGVAVISYETLSKFKKIEINLQQAFRFVLCDEAHKLKNPKNKRYQNAQSILSKANHIIMLSATPESGIGDCINLYGLLFSNREKPPIEYDNSFFREDSHYCTNTKKEALRQKKVERIIEKEEFKNSIHDECEVYKNFSDIFSALNNPLFKSVTEQIISSSMYAGYKFIEKIMNKDDISSYLKNIITENGYLEEIDDEDESCSEDFNIDEIIYKVEHLYKKMQVLMNDKEYTEWKMKYFLEILKNHEKVVVFANYKSTIEYLSEQLCLFDVSYKIITGDIEWGERLDNYRQFVSNSTKVLLMSNVGSEGLDMDIADAVVNYDMHYNPVVLEQRIGRIDRITQKKDKIYIYNYYNEYSDNNLHKKLKEKIQKIEKETGNYYEIIDKTSDANEVIDYSELKTELTKFVFNSEYILEDVDAYIKDKRVEILKKNLFKDVDKNETSIEFNVKIIGNHIYINDTKFEMSDNEIYKLFFKGKLLSDMLIGG